LIEPNAVREVPSLLLNCGVRLVVVEWLPGTKIDGVCTWLDSDKPVIGLSTLHDRLDNFWFVLRHEIEHVLRGDGKAVPVFDNLDEPVGIQEPVFDDAERVANEAAADFCVPRDKMLSFYQRKQPFISERDVLAFASLVGVHPAIVVGQLQHMMKRHNYLRKYQVPIRKHILEAALSDGFGSVAPVSL
jgi:HTH-type transcriptional regulator/antitoxin HigA